MNKLTYLIPVFNAINTLGETYQSLKNQTYKNFSILFVDDGSQDKSLDLLEKIEKSDNRVSIIRNKHQGLVKTLNDGLLHINSDWIIRLDSDDLAYPTRTEYIVKTINKIPPNTALITSDAELINEKGDFQSIIKINPYLAKYFLFTGINPFFHSSVAINKSLIGNNILYRERFKHAEDYDMWIRLLSKYKFKHISKPLIKYRIHQNQVTKNYPYETIKNKYLSLQETSRNYPSGGLFYLFKNLSLLLIKITRKIELKIAQRTVFCNKSISNSFKILEIIVFKIILKLFKFIMFPLNLLFINKVHRLLNTVSKN